MLGARVTPVTMQASISWRRIDFFCAVFVEPRGRLTSAQGDELRLIASSKHADDRGLEVLFDFFIRAATGKVEELFQSLSHGRHGLESSKGLSHPDRLDRSGGGTARVMSNGKWKNGVGKSGDVGWLVLFVVGGGGGTELSASGPSC